jgi:hypothetical protein
VARFHIIIPSLTLSSPCHDSCHGKVTRGMRINIPNLAYQVWPTHGNSSHFPSVFAHRNSCRPIGGATISPVRIRESFEIIHVAWRLRFAWQCDRIGDEIMQEKDRQMAMVRWLECTTNDL